jgi:tRNA nucleotidyltransferase (CCA-adding enzyme)
MNYRLPSQVNTAIELLYDSGFEAFAVGGCIRDTVMGTEPHDFDITTSAYPDEMKEVFKCFRVIETGIKHGTLTVIIDGMPLEITTYRIDGEYRDNRHPENVSFSRELKDDLSRRDFTVNTLCYNEKEGLVDLFGGVKDIENRVIRCVGKPDRRFSEDALRIIRALRFSSVLGFEIEKETAESILRNRELLNNIAVERIRDEFTKLICGDRAFDIIMNYHEVLEQFIPELSPLCSCEQNTNYHLYNVLEHTAHALESIENDRILRLVMFFHDIAKPLCKTTDMNGFDHFKGHAALGEIMTGDILKRLKYDNATVNRVSRLVGLHSERTPKDKIETKLMLCEAGIEDCKAFMKIRKADCLAKANPHSHDEKLRNMQGFLDEIEKNSECYSLAQLNIDGNDLKALGFKGKRMSVVLRALLMDVIEEEIPNENEALRQRASEML